MMVGLDFFFFFLFFFFLEKESRGRRVEVPVAFVCFSLYAE